MESLQSENSVDFKMVFAFFCLLMFIFELFAPSLPPYKEIDQNMILWGPMGTYGALWSPMEIYKALWGPMGLYGALWEHMGTYGALWGPMGPPGPPLGSPRAPHGSLWEAHVGPHGDRQEPPKSLHHLMLRNKNTGNDMCEAWHCLHNTPLNLRTD